MENTATISHSQHCSDFISYLCHCIAIIWPLVYIINTSGDWLNYRVNENILVLRLNYSHIMVIFLFQLSLWSCMPYRNLIWYGTVCKIWLLIFFISKLNKELLCKKERRNEGKNKMMELNKRLLSTLWLSQKYSEAC